jgi:Zn-dependent protease
MKALRLTSAVIYVLVGLAHLAAPVFLVFLKSKLKFKIPPQLDLWEIVATTVVFSALYFTSAYQLTKGKGRGFAWLTAITIGPLGFASIYLAPLAIPLLYLVAEVAYPYVTKKPLDKSVKEKAERGKTELLTWAVTIPAILLVGYLFQHMPGIVTPKGGRESSFVLFIIYTWVIIVLHEIGHAAVGHFLGFDLITFAVFPIELRRIGKTQIVWNPALGGHYSGLPRTHENLWRRHLLMVAGGPAANVLTFFLCWLVLWIAQGRMAGLGFSFISGLMIWSLVTALFNLVPLKFSQFKTDGRHIWDAFFNPVESRRALAVLGCMTSRSAMLRPRDWPAEWVQSLRQAEPDVASVALLTAWAQDRLLADPADWEALDVLQANTVDLERLAADLPDAQAKAALNFHVDWLRVRYDGIVTPRVSEHLDAARKNPATDTYELLRMEAALRLASGEPTEGLRLLNEAEADLVKQTPSGFKLSDLEDLRAFRQLAA